MILKAFSSLDDSIILCFASRPENKVAAAILAQLGMLRCGGDRQGVRSPRGWKEPNTCCSSVAITEEFMVIVLLFAVPLWLSGSAPLRTHQWDQYLSKAERSNQRNACLMLPWHLLFHTPFV